MTAGADVSREMVAHRVSMRCYLDELAAARALGYDEVSAIASAFHALDDVYQAAFEPARPAVLTRFRPMGQSR